MVFPCLFASCKDQFSHSVYIKALSHNSTCFIKMMNWDVIVQGEHKFASNKIHFGTWLTEIQQSDWLAAVIHNSVDRAVENHVLKQ